MWITPVGPAGKPYKPKYTHSHTHTCLSSSLSRKHHTHSFSDLSEPEVQRLELRKALIFFGKL